MGSYLILISKKTARLFQPIVRCGELREQLAHEVTWKYVSAGLCARWVEQRATPPAICGCRCHSDHVSSAQVVFLVFGLKVHFPNVLSNESIACVELKPCWSKA